MTGSRPVWGAWIEICSLCPWDCVNGRSRPVWGAWIEIEYLRKNPRHYERRAPYGARGLKWLWVGLITQADESRPVWGAWIEILS